MTLQDKLKQVIDEHTSPLSQLAGKITKLIEDNLDEALKSDSEYIRQKAEQLKEK